MLHALNETSSSSPAGRATSPAAAKRLEAIGEVVSSLDVAAIQSREDMTRALCALELANKCIRVVLDEVQGHSMRDHLIGESGRLIDMIKAARQRVADLRIA